MFSALLCGRIFGPPFPRDPVLYNPLQVLFWMLCWLAGHPVLLSSIFVPTTDGGLGHENMAWQFFLLLRFTLLFICVKRPWSDHGLLSASFNDWGEDSISPGVSSSQHCLVSPARWRAVSFWSSVGVKCSCRGAAFPGLSNNQEGAYHSLSVRAVRCPQGGLNGFFV